jgi:hypothetical protein
MNGSIRVYHAETPDGHPMCWPKGMLVMSLGDYNALRAENGKLWTYAQHKQNCAETLAEPSEEGTCKVLTRCNCGLAELAEQWRKRHLADPFAQPQEGQQK